MNNNMIKKCLVACLVFFCIPAQAVNLEDIKFATLPGDKTEIKL